MTLGAALFHFFCARSEFFAAFAPSGAEPAYETFLSRALACLPPLPILMMPLLKPLYHHICTLATLGLYSAYPATLRRSCAVVRICCIMSHGPHNVGHVTSCGGLGNSAGRFFQQSAASGCLRYTAMTASSSTEAKGAGHVMTEGRDRVHSLHIVGCSAFSLAHALSRPQA